MVIWKYNIPFTFKSECIVRDQKSVFGLEFSIFWGYHICGNINPWSKLYYDICRWTSLCNSHESLHPTGLSSYSPPPVTIWYRSISVRDKTHQTAIPASIDMGQLIWKGARTHKFSVLLRLFAVNNIVYVWTFLPIKTTGTPGHPDFLTYASNANLSLKQQNRQKNN